MNIKLNTSRKESIVKYICSLIVAFTCVMSAGFGLHVHAEEFVYESSDSEIEGATNNATTIKLFPVDTMFMDESKYISSSYYNDFVTARNGAIETYTFSYGSQATYKVTGNTVTVSAEGVVTPAYTTWYWWNNYGTTSPGDGSYTRIEKDFKYGDSTVSVTYGGTTTTYTFSVCRFEEIYAEQKAWEYINSNITASMSTYEKFCKIVQYPASMDYSPAYQGYIQMIVFGGGDCWASTNTINYMCELLGIPCHTRYGANDSGAGGGHRNNIALIDGQLYIGDAGYSGIAPRYYSISSIASPYTYSNNGTILHYDGFDTELIVPEKIGTTTITTINALAFSTSLCIVTPTKIVLPNTITTLNDQALEYIPNITEITVPQNVSSIGKLVFTQCDKLENIYVAAGNDYFSSVNGVLFNKDKTVLLYYPTNGQKEYSVPTTVTKLDQYSFYYTKGIEKLTIPASVKSIGEGALGDTQLKEIYFLGDKPELGDFVFAYSNATIYYPAGNTTWAGIEDEAFTYYTNVKFVAVKGNGNEVKGVSLTLDGSIGLNFHVQLDSKASTIRLQSINGTKDFKVSELTGMSGGTYCVTYTVPAKNISDKITISILDASGNKMALTNNTAGNNTLSCSVQDYLDIVSANNKNLSNLISALKTYCQCAKVYFNYNVPAYSPQITAINYDKSYQKVIYGTLPDGITYLGSSLILEENITVRHYFRGNNDFFDMKYDGYVNGIGYIEQKNISPASFDSKQTIVKYGWAIQYSVFSYCYDAQQNNTGNVLNNLINSIYWYNKAAKEYINSTK